MYEHVHFLESDVGCGEVEGSWVGEDEGRKVIFPELCFQHLLPLCSHTNQLLGFGVRSDSAPVTRAPQPSLTQLIV